MLAAGLSLFSSAMGELGESVAARVIARTGVQRVPTAKAEVFQARRFIPAPLCEALIALIEADRRPSTIADDIGDPAFRTSETCDLPDTHPAVRELEQRFADLSGLDPAHGEPIQGQRYAVGQEFKAHTDYFDPLGADYQRFCALSGQRTWTFMIYLNDVAAGGATRFRHLSKMFQPEMGKLLFWNNRLEDGAVNPATLHHGMKVRRGVKYVITKWYREDLWRG